MHIDVRVTQKNNWKRQSDKWKIPTTQVPEKRKVKSVTARVCVYVCVSESEQEQAVGILSVFILLNENAIR